jgi:hypothetical protein
LQPKNETPAGIGPTGVQGEKVMHNHHSLLLKTVAILRIRVKIIIVRR